LALNIDLPLGPLKVASSRVGEGPEYCPSEYKGYELNYDYTLDL